MPATNVKWIGLDMYLYRNTGSFGSPAWTLVDNVEDLKRQSKLDEAEIKIRKMRDVQYEPGLNAKQFSWSMLKDETDTNYTALRTAKDAGTLIEFAFANGPIATSGTVYYRQECKLFGWDDDEPISGAVMTQVTAKPCKSANASSWTTTP
jgi:hypothetical protein